MRFTRNELDAIIQRDSIRPRPEGWKRASDNLWFRFIGTEGELDINFSSSSPEERTREEERNRGVNRMGPDG